MARKNLKLKRDNSKNISAICFFTTSENRVRKIFFEVLYCLVSACTITCLTFYEGNEFPLFPSFENRFYQGIGHRFIVVRKPFEMLSQQRAFKNCVFVFIILYKRSIKRKCGTTKFSVEVFLCFFNVRISRYNLCQKSVFIKRCFMP